MSSKSRNVKRRIFRNRHRNYIDVFKRKKKAGLVQWTTPRFRQISPVSRRSIFEISHVWKTGDRFYKLAHQYYNYSEYWWVIAWYNKRPTDAHYNLGDKVFIPKPLEKILRNFRV